MHGADASISELRRDPNTEVIVLGDSLTFGTQNEICFINQQSGFRTRMNFSVGGFSAKNWLEDTGAMFVIANAASQVVYVSLGTNDVSKLVLGTATLADVAQDMANVAANAGSRCVVWQGVNEQWDGVNGANPSQVLVTPARAAEYNQMVREYAASHPNVKFADFNAFVRDNQTIRDGILADASEAHPIGAAARTAYALFVTQQFRGLCGVLIHRCHPARLV